MAALLLELQRMPPTVKPEHHKETRFGQLLEAALKAKSEELAQTGIPGTYSYRMLAQDAGIHFSYVGKMIHGIQQPSPDVVEAVIRALDPYLPADEAMIAAGYMPRSPRLSRLLRRMARYPLDRVEGMDRTLAKVYFRDVKAIEDDESLYQFNVDYRRKKGDSEKTHE